MKKVFCILAMLVFMTTVMLQLYSDNDVYNEDEEVETRYYNKMGETWKVKQRGRDSEDNGNLSTSVSTYTAQTKAWTHAMSAYAYYNSSYTDPKFEGQWYLRAQLNHSWATDEEPFEDSGKIYGKKYGMNKSGSQSDIDYFAWHDPLDTITDCDSFAEATIYHPSQDKNYRSVAYSYFSGGELAEVEEEAP